MRFNHACPDAPAPVIAPSAAVLGTAWIGAGESLVRAGACVKQRDHFPARSVLDGFPARVVGTLDAPPERPSWVLSRLALQTLVRIR